MRKLIIALALVAGTAGAMAQDLFKPYQATALRLPSVPLIMNDPFFSIWSPFDKLTDGTTRHWSDQQMAIDGLLRVDGTTYRFMGREKEHLFQSVVPMADEEAWQAQVTYDKQGSTAWVATNFEDSTWTTETAAWGSPKEYPNIRTSWTAENSDIYIRRHFTLTQEQYDSLQTRPAYILFSHDDVCEVYLNGREVTTTGETWIQRDYVKLDTRFQKRTLHVGNNVLAYHVHNTFGGANADIGIFRDMKDIPEGIQTAQQNGYAQVMACNTYYNFTCGPVDLDLVFTVPMAMDSLDLVSTPINYVSYRVKANDGQKHSVQIYFATTPDLTVKSSNVGTTTRIITNNAGGFKYLRTGKTDQKTLSSKGDLIKIDWGYLYMPDINGEVNMATQNAMENQFVNDGTLASFGKIRFTADGEVDMPMLAYRHDFGTVEVDSSYMMLAYDELYDVQFMGTKYKGYWARNGKTLSTAIAEYRDGYKDNMLRARAWDKQIYDDAMASGNKNYAEVLSANYRQVLGAHKLFQDKDGDVMFFSKENNSGGFINTVDVTYPAAPLLLIYNTELEKGALAGIFKYCADRNHWGFDFPAHDLGTYPIADDQLYSWRFPGNNGDFGGNMPLEEAGNMVCLATMVSLRDGNTDFARKYWDQLTTWTNYLADNGQDPADQLCTDDFAGRSEHNTNLSLKAIMGVAGYALMAREMGDTATYDSYMAKARAMATQWESDAETSDHWKRTFDNDDTWSLKYNMVWDKVWNTGLFSEDKLKREMDYYQTKKLAYGVPLDNRESYTKSDWEIWVATMADSQEGFDLYADLLWNYCNATPSRVPFCDWYWAGGRGEMRGFRARSVVGGHWMKVLCDKFKVDPQFPATGINAVETQQNLNASGIRAVYDLSGRQLAQPQKGINIVKYNNGRTRKVVVK